MSSSLPSSSRPRIRYAQNFLKDSAVVATLLDRSGMERDAVVYEIGPGEGVITAQLARRYQRVVAIEQDPRLTTLLLRKFADQPNVTIIAGDFLRYCLPRQPYNVFASIPFNITSAIVAKLTTGGASPDLAYLTMQREAAQVFLGRPHSTLRAALLYPWFALEIVHRFKRADFIPAPRVDVVMLRLRKRGPPLVSSADRQGFRDLVTYSFTAWQPSLGETLTRIFTPRQLNVLSSALGCDLDVPPSSIACEQWLCLFNSMKTLGNDRAQRLIAGSEHRLARQHKRLEKVHLKVGAGAPGFRHGGEAPRHSPPTPSLPLI